MLNDFVYVSVSGKNIDIFLNKLIRKNIFFKLYKKTNNTAIFKIRYNNYLKLNEIKSIYKIEVIRYTGFLKYYKIILNNFSMFAFFLISLFILYLLSITCFNIVILHNDKKIRNMVKYELKKYNVREFRIIPNYKRRKKIIEKIVKNNNEILEWLEIEKKGSNLFVKVVERKINKKEKENVARNIVARKEGIIKKIDVSKGQIEKKVNDYVKKGDIIVSGNITKDDEIKSKVSATGNIYAEVWYTVNVEYPLYYDEIIYLDKQSSNLVIKYLNYKFNLKGNYKNIKEEKKYILLKYDIFPFEIYIQKQRKIKKISKKLSCKKALNKAIKIANYKINSKLKKNEYIYNKNALNYSCNNSKIYVDVFFKVYENIAKYEDIKDEENIE